jgi:hypothetical protein
LSLDHVGHIFIKHQSKKIKNLIEKIKANDFATIDTDSQYIDVCKFKENYLASSLMQNKSKIKNCNDGYMA